MLVSGLSELLHLIFFVSVCRFHAALQIEKMSADMNPKLASVLSKIDSEKKEKKDIELKGTPRTLEEFLCHENLVSISCFICTVLAVGHRYRAVKLFTDYSS